MISGHLTGWVQANNSLFCCLLFRESLYLHLQYMFSPFTWTCISQSWNVPRMVFWSWGNFPRFAVHRPMFLFNNINLFKNNFSSSLPSHCVCNFKFPCAVFFTRLHIFHTILFWTINININKHRNQLPCDRVFVMLSCNFLWQIVSLLWFQPHLKDRTWAGCNHILCLNVIWVTSSPKPCQFPTQISWARIKPF